MEIIGTCIHCLPAALPASWPANFISSSASSGSAGCRKFCWSSTCYDRRGAVPLPVEVRSYKSIDYEITWLVAYQKSGRDKSMAYEFI